MLCLLDWSSRRCGYISLFFFLVIETGFLKAQMPVDTLAADTLPVFSATAAPAFIYATRNRSPFTTSSVSNTDISFLQEPTIEPLLNATPGLWMQTGALNTNRISIRGIGYNEPFATTGIKVYLDEIPLTNGAGESSIEDIHPLILSGIDIWRGPSSAIWGSGLGGMIHLKTMMPTYDVVSSKLQLGSFGRLQYDHHAAFRYGKKDQMATTLHYQRLQDDGYRNNNEYRKHSLTWLQHWASNRTWQLSSFIHAIDLQAFIPSSINEIDFRDQPHIAAPGWGDVRANEDYIKYIAGVHLSLFALPDVTYKGALYSTFFDSDEVRPFNVLHESNLSYGMRHRVSWHVRPGAYVHIGMEYYHEDYKFSTFETLADGTAGSLLSDYAEDRTYVNGFIQSEFDLSARWFLFAGLHVAQNRLSGVSLKSNFPLALYPTLGTSYEVGKEMILTASVSRGYASLSLDDILNSSGQIATGIKPETGWSEELSFQLGKRNRKFMRIGVYNMHIDNTIVTVRPDENTFEKQNLGESLHQGLEGEGGFILFEGKLDVSSVYTLQFNQSGLSGDREFLEGYPRHRVVNTIHYYPAKEWEWHVTHAYRSGISLQKADSEAENVLHLVNLGSTYHLDAGQHWRFSLSGHIHNLFNTHHASMFVINPAAVPTQFPRYFYPGKPRAVYVSFQVQYRFV